MAMPGLNCAAGNLGDVNDPGAAARLTGIRGSHLNRTGPLPFLAISSLLMTSTCLE